MFFLTGSYVANMKGFPVNFVCYFSIRASVNLIVSYMQLYEACATKASNIFIKSCFRNWTVLKR